MLDIDDRIFFEIACFTLIKITAQIIKQNYAGGSSVHLISIGHGARPLIFHRLLVVHLMLCTNYFYYYSVVFNCSVVMLIVWFNNFSCSFKIETKFIYINIYIIIIYLLQCKFSKFYITSINPIIDDNPLRTMLFFKNINTMCC